ncbi:NUDIX hydrolase [Intrasporangium oryzae NRRL B-24470]|uniref:NUDIX hydrolase n=1 Tax=Intrasporangium oryzae NRRL B-24470 TaxID=1386089 RepID=W9G8C0_9MICO|nr:NUDIX hydrolase [Intrasporangium oryzae]EWT00104.1 NUDIX hydrolase [Intrasporangium oryzae NRRL B-24470]
MELAHRLAAAVWLRSGDRLQRWVLRWRNDTFLVGVTGVVRDPEGRVLVLRHRYWNGNPYGLPSGHVHRGESWEAALVREVREETGLDVGRPRVIGAEPGPAGRVEVLAAGTVEGGSVPRADGTEVTEARFVSVEEASTLLRRAHREMVARAVTS